MIHASTDTELTPDGHSRELALVRKYAIPGPRYTSYPAATAFTIEFDDLAAVNAIDRDNTLGDVPAASRPLSLYIHLPFCESLCWYCGCNNVITRDRAAADAYLDHLATEIALTTARVAPGRPVAQLHLGGGTPTFLTVAQMRRLGQILRDHFVFAPDAEISVEIDPRHLNAGQVEALVELGVNRASLGIQDTDPVVQAAIHRIQPHSANFVAVDRLRAAGIHAINLDLIYGLPRQSEPTFRRTLDDALSLSPSRVSLFSYAHVPWMRPAQRIFDQTHSLPTTEEKFRLFALGRSRLTEAGLIDIGLDHFARPDDELALALAAGTLHRNFQGYSTRAGASLYAFGVSSISATAGSYRQNFKTIDAYRNALAAGRLPVERGIVLTAEDLRRRAAIMGIMSDRRLDFAALGEKIGADPRQHFHAELASLTDLEDDGIVERDASGLRVTDLGLPLLRVVAMRFDHRLEHRPARHSSTV